MTRVVRLAKLEELSRTLALALRLIREIETGRVLARLQAEEPERWELATEALRAAQAPGMAGSVANVRGILASALDRD